MDNIVKYYSSFDEWGRLDREPVEFIVNLHFIKSCLPSEGKILDNGAGPGKYTMELARLGYDVTLTDLTPTLVEKAIEKVKEQGLESNFDECLVADARDLNMFPDDHFDGVLMLGPMYHLQTEEDRNKALSELYRVTKKNGYIFVAFMSRIRFLTTSLMSPQFWKPNHTVDGITKFMDTGVFNHTDEGRFTGAYYFNIDEIEPCMKEHGFTKEKLVASGSVVGNMKPEQWDYWRSQGEEDYKKIMQLVFDSAEDPYILGASSHLLYIGRKS